MPLWYNFCISMNPEDRIKELETKLAACEQRNTAKSEFLSIVSHQLRTPLSGTKWIFKMLMDGDLGAFTDEQKDIVRKGYESNEQMIKLLNEIIVANQNEEWEFKYSFCKSDLEKIIESIITEFLEEARVKNVRIIFERPYRNFPLIELDPEKIRLAIQNLIENAIKYSHEDGKVVITLIPRTDTISLDVQDSGIGITAEQQEKIFQKFFRADNAKTHKKTGTGLGLFTARAVVERHHGKLSFKSIENRGTTFTVTLPIVQP